MFRLRLAVVALVVLGSLWGTTASGEMMFDLAGGATWLMKPGQPAVMVRGIAAGISYQPTYQDSIASPLRFRVRYQEDIYFAGMSFDVLSWKGITLSPGANFVLKGSTEAMRIGGQGVFSVYFLEGKQPMEFSIGVGYLPPIADEDRPIVFTLTMGALTQ